MDCRFPWSRALRCRRYPSATWHALSTCCISSPPLTDSRSREELTRFCMCQLQYDAREVVPVMRCLNLTSVVSTWFSAVLDDSHAAAMCVPALSVAGGESFDTPDCPGLFDSQAYATSCNGGCRGLWQMSGSTVGYPNDDDPLKQAQLAYSLYTSDNIDYGCLASWRSATPIQDIGQNATIMEHHVFCREVWTGAGDHYLTMGLNRIGGLSTVTSACSATAIGDSGGGGYGGGDDSSGGDGSDLAQSISPPCPQQPLSQAISPPSPQPPFALGGAGGSALVAIIGILLGVCTLGAGVLCYWRHYAWGGGIRERPASRSIAQSALPAHTGESWLVRLLAISGQKPPAANARAPVPPARSALPVTSSADDSPLVAPLEQLAVAWDGWWSSFWRPADRGVRGTATAPGMGTAKV